MRDQFADVDDPATRPSSAVRRRRPRTALYAAVGVGLVLAAFVAVLATRDSAASRLADTPLLGKPAPEITGTTLDGEQLSLSSLRGKFVLVNMFATWCVPCRNEHPELIKFSQRHRARGDAQLVAVIWDDDPALVRKFFEERGGDWPVLEDPGGKIALELGVRGPPETYVIDPDGIVIARFVGEVTADGLDDVIREARRSRA